MRQQTESSTYKDDITSRPVTAVLMFIAGLPILGFIFLLSISVGAADVEIGTVWNALFHYDASLNDHVVIRELRLPRAVADIFVGACFAVAGAIMQGMTRNPLAESGILGINAGSIFMVAVCFAFLPGLSYNLLIVFSFLGAAISMGLIFGIASLSRIGLTPLRMVLAGAAINALFTALSEGIAIHFDLSQDIAFWYAGGLSGVRWEQLLPALPWMGGALIFAVALSRSVTILSLGDDIASGLGQRVGLIKLLCTLAVLFLAGIAVSIAGPIGFVGLVIPHVVRFFVGVDYRAIIPCSIVVGGIFMSLADIGARIINPPYEIPLGSLFALIGVPFFLYIARRERREL
jgi:iron complex transport system permease protein